MTLQSNLPSWARQNFGNVYLGDIRRTKKLVALAEAMASEPGISITKLAKTWYDAKAYYNLLKSTHMKPDIIQSNHRLSVAEEINKAENDVLLIEDASELSWSGNEPIEGLGPVGSGRKHDQGFILHSVLAVETIPFATSPNPIQNTSRGPVRILGLIDQQYYVRPEKRKQTKRRRETNEMIETDLWRNTLNRMLDLSTEKKRIIRVCDRAADIYEVIIETDLKGFDYVIRGRHNRTLEDVKDENDKPLRLFDHPDLDISKTSCEVYQRGRIGKKARVSLLNVSCAKATTQAPSRPGRKSGELESLEYNVIRVWEDSQLVSEDEKIEWFLLTSLPIETEAELLRAVEIYCTRWVIEDYHKALKTGLKAENLQLESVQGLMAAVSIMSVVALRLVELRERVRIMPDAPAEESSLSELELKVLSRYLKRKLETVRDVALAVGRLGGHLNRKGDGMPGIITLWLGMSQLIQLVKGVQLAAELNCN